MILLYLAAFVPLPARDGDRVRAELTLRGLARRHAVHGFFLDPDGAGVPAGVRRLCASATVVPLPRARTAAGALRALAGGEPLHTRSFWWPGAQRTLEELAARRRPAGVHVHRLRMMPYASRLDLPYLLDATDCLTAYYRLALAAEGAGGLTGWRRVYAKRDLARVRGAETRAARGAAATLVTTALERDRMRAVAGGARVLVVPNGLDLARWRFRPRASRPGGPLFVGNLGYPPNEAGLLWYLREVAPRIPAPLTIVGGGASARLRRAARRAGARMAGWVPDVRPSLWRAGALVCPLPWASGVQNKVLQAFACGTPVVATPNIARALGAKPGRDFLPAATPPAFAGAVRRVLEDHRLAAALARGARALAATRHSLAAAHRALDRAAARLERAA